jgi:hypothetical protein
MFFFKKLGVVVYTYNPNTWEAEAKRLQVCSHLRIHSKFWASLSYMVRPVSKQQQCGALVAHICNPSSLEGLRFRPALANSS